MRIITDKKPCQIDSSAGIHQTSIYDWENIFNSMTDMVTIHDKDFNIIYANAVAAKKLKIPSFARRKVKCFKYYHGTTCPPEECPSCRCLKTGIPFTSEIYEPYLKKYIEIRALPRYNAKHDIAGIIHIVRDITGRKQQEKKLKESRQMLRNLTAHLLMAREQERENIAREIHDELAQSLTALKMEFIMMAKKLPGNRRLISETIRPISEMIDNTIGMVQSVCVELRPHALDNLGLEEAIKWQSRKFQDRTGIHCSVKGGFTGAVLTREYDINLIRILQESLTNVYRHAWATKVWIILSLNADALQMKVSDNGRGIVKKAIDSPTSLGIIGIRERVNLMKGKIEIKGTPDNKGTSVLVNVPLTKAGSKNHRKQQTRIC